MIKSTLDRTKTSYFSNLANDLVYKQEVLFQFIEPLIDINSFKNQIGKKQMSYNVESRDVLVSHFKKQYENVSNSELAHSQISLLKKSNTFTVTTGHQLSVFTGPLFFIYKLVHTIKLTRKLKETYPDFDFIPIYWMASEDHDFEEINHLYNFGNKIEWNSQQSGAVGRFLLSDFESVKIALLEKFERDEPIKELINKHYLSGLTLSQATFNFVHELFGSQGLLILDADNKVLKACFSPYMVKELEDSFSKKAVEDQNKKLENLGYGLQVHPRDVNLFYLSEDGRDRIIKEGKDFVIGDSIKDLAFLKNEIKVAPEKFSPNVVLRPLYQEVILPNLCYIGGGGEIAYWTQLKSVFEKSNIPFPLLMVRNSVQLIDKGTQKKIEKLNLTAKDFFGDLNQLKKQYVLTHPETNLDFDALDETADGLVTKMEALIIDVDPNMVSYAKSETTRLKKQLDQVKTKMIRHQKKQMEETMKQIDAIHDKLFPNSGLQERHDNFLQWEAITQGELFKILLDNLDPFEKDLIILEL